MTSLFWPAASTAAVGFGVYAFVRGFQSLRLQRVIRDTPTARIRSLAMGLVELQGRVHARSRMSAPFSARSCAWWEVELQTLRRSKNGLRQCTPRLDDPGMERLPWVDFSSGYIQRAVDKFPKQGARRPWRLHQNYAMDLMSLRYGSLRDKAMVFSR